MDYGTVWSTFLPKRVTILYLKVFKNARYIKNNNFKWTIT